MTKKHYETGEWYPVQWPGSHTPEPSGEAEITKVDPKRGVIEVGEPRRRKRRGK